MDIDTSRYREGLPQIGYAPYRQIHAHSTGNKKSTAQNEADYHMRRPVESGFFSHVVGNGRVMQVGPVNNGSYDVGGGWNYETYAAVELIESHSTKEEFMEDYRLYIELLRNLADEAGLPKTLDSDALEGIKSHEYCTNNQPNNYSDHVDRQAGASVVSNSSMILKTVLKLKKDGKKILLVGGMYVQMALIQKRNLKKSMVPGIILTVLVICSRISGRSIQTANGTI